MAYKSSWGSTVQYGIGPVVANIYRAGHKKKISTFGFRRNNPGDAVKYVQFSFYFGNFFIFIKWWKIKQWIIRLQCKIKGATT